MRLRTGVLLAGTSVFMSLLAGCGAKYGVYEDVEAVHEPVQQVHQTYYRKPGFVSKGKKVAVMDFKGSGVGHGQAFADILATNLFANGVEVVERQNVDALLREFRLAREGNKDLSDTEIIQKIGRMADVDIVIVGGIVEYKESVGQAAPTSAEEEE
ncbi:MAG: hypothetical protein HN750_07820 [Gemmatimonadales bacterium]|jgi:curli biogenesis system outer membrane secretion channel CsgG|nr:hypothetical protein [Gemmatimonadales bacterium]